MNFLAHIYLSGDNTRVTIGNFMADGIKGKDYKEYSPELKTGTLLHRHIDTYTDAHKTVRLSTKRLHEKYGHYSGVIVDILYDHFLAKNWQQYSDTPLNIYAENVYSLLQSVIETLPPKIQQTLPYMIEYNWLVAYASTEGIERVLQGMNRRTKGISKMDLAIEDLNNYYNELELDFTTFFKDLIDFTNKKTTLLLSL